MTKLPDYQFTFSVKSVFAAAGLIGGMYLAFQLKDVLIALFISILFTAAVNPYVTKLTQKGISRSLSITLVFGIILSSVMLILAAVIPPFVRELYNLINTVSIPPSLRESILNLDYSLQDLEVILNQLKGIPKVIDTVSSVFSIVLIALTFGIVTFYMLMERPGLHKYLVWLLGKSKDEKKAEHFVNSLETQIGGWVRGEALLMIIIGSITYISLLLLGVPYALPLAILAGMLEILPNIGPTLACLPALLVAYTNGSFMQMGIVGIVYILIQQIENNFIVPGIMRKAAGLNPLITILVMITGLRLSGFLGAFIAVPLFLCVKVFIKEFYKHRTLKNEFGDE